MKLLNQGQEALDQHSEHQQCSWRSSQKPSVDFFRPSSHQPACASGRLLLNKQRAASVCSVLIPSLQSLATAQGEPKAAKLVLRLLEFVQVIPQGWAPFTEFQCCLGREREAYLGVLYRE